MAMTIEENTIGFQGVIYEDEVTPLRDFLQERAPERITFDFTECDDVHLAVLQLIMAYRKLYACEYRFASTPGVYQKVLEGFEPLENDCDQ